jgi:hypothetical protein
MERDGLEVLDGHLFGKRDDVTEFIYFAHGVVEDAGDDAAMAVAGRAGVAVTQIEVADEGIALFVEREDEAHPVGIVGTTNKTSVRGQFQVFGFVAMDLAGHGGILTGKRKNISPTEGVECSEESESTFSTRSNPVYISVLSFLLFDKGSEERALSVV